MSTPNGSRPIRWLHLSDFHVGKDDYAQRKMFDYILAHVRQRKEHGFLPDFVFITGDLANKGQTKEYETFWQDFVWPLQEAIGGDISTRTFVVPGNHDVDRDKYNAIDRDDITKPESQYLDPTKEGERRRGELLVPRIQAYLDNDCTTDKGAIAGRDGAYARRLTLHGHEVGIVGINTAWLSKGDDDREKLTPGKPLLEKALEGVKDVSLRIVLGHHPIDWFIPAQRKSIQSLLGKHQVLYLHGHLHDAWAEPTYGGGQSFLAIQSGAGFQAREGEQWRNGLVWGEANLDAGEVRLQPWRWIADQQAWTPATDAFHEHYRQGDWWHFPLPSDQPAKVNYAPVKAPVQPPKGWTVFKVDDLAPHCASLAPETALRFFDGAVPDWSTALSRSIPPRKIVGRLTETFAQAESADKSIVTLLLAAGCEGKTTALLQTAHAVIGQRQDWRILQRRDESQPLSPDDLLPVLDKDFHWLLVVDESDRVATNLLALLKHLPRELHGRVHALLACRDSDWRASGADTLDWSGAIVFHQERMEGLDQDDAQAIVQAWQTYGDAGLGDLARTPADQRAGELERQAREEAKTKQGAFFGALLAVRQGADLANHARLLLERLGQRKILGGGTLRDALAYIAAMHAQGLEFLSRPALAQALGCPPDKLHREVLVPLGQEAAATTTSSFIYTRHRRIAETLVGVLEREFGEDVGTLFVELGSAAIDVMNAKQYLPENPKEWRFNIADHFFDQGQRELAFRIAQAVLSREPANSLTRTHVANLYRRAGLPDQGVRVFREAPGLVEGNRAFYYEWGVAEGECGNAAANVILASYSLSNECSFVRVDNYDARISLAGLGEAFGSLYDAYRDPAFRDARMAVATLGLTLPFDEISEKYLPNHAREAASQGAIQPDQEQAFRHLHAGVVAAAQVGLDSYLTDLLPKAEELSFAGLEQLVGHASHAR